MTACTINWNIYGTAQKFEQATPSNEFGLRPGQEKEIVIEDNEPYDQSVGMQGAWVFCGTADDHYESPVVTAIKLVVAPDG